MKMKVPQLAGKVLSVVCAGEDTGQLIADPSFEEQGGRLFLIGTVPKNASRDNWMEGLSCAIAWDTVQDYVIFASMDDYLTRLHTPHGRVKARTRTGHSPG
jgi:hypothetical protein